MARERDGGFGERIRVRLRLLVVAALVLVLLDLAPPVGAWNQFWPTGGAGTTCANTNAAPCVRWRKSGSNGSITIQLYLSPTLDLGDFDLTQDVQAAKSAYNNIPAFNPLVQVTNDQSQAEMVARTLDFQDPTIFGDTTFVPFPFDLNNDRIEHVTIRFNSDVFWKRSVNGWCDYQTTPIECHQDARKVANHEFGHAEGLAHEVTPTQAIMRQGFLTWYALQQDDKDGIIAIYGAIP